MTRIAQFASLAEVRRNLDLPECQLVAMIAAGRLAQALMHPPSPQPN